MRARSSLPKEKTPQHQGGFTLAEISIVLVIIGLLVGGIVAGRSLVHSTMLKAITREEQQYIAALNNFHDQYKAIPGDMRDAASYWGAQAGATSEGVDSTCAALTSGTSATATCNGNGDGQIGVYASSSLHHEVWRSWQHLADAGFIEGRFTGVPGAGNDLQAVLGTNAPRSKLEGAGWNLFYLGTYSDTNWALAKYGNILLIGGDSTVATTQYNVTPMLLAEDAQLIDSKMDDGNAFTGNVLTRLAAAQADCVDASNYLVAKTVPGCILAFVTGY